MKENRKHQNLGAWWVKYLLPNPGTLIILLLFLLAPNTVAAPWQAPAAAPTSTGVINYQGRLFDASGNPINGQVDLTFSLYDQVNGGNRKWGPETHTDVPVSDGLFSVLLGSRTANGIPSSALGGNLWLETAVNGETLSPREQLGAVPYAMWSNRASLADTVPDDSIISAKIANGTVREADLANDVVTSAKIVDKTIQARDIANGAVTSAKIADGTVTQTDAPTLLQGQGKNRIVRWGNVVVRPNAWGDVTILFPAFPNGIDTFVAMNGDSGAGQFVVNLHESGMGKDYAHLHLSNLDGSHHTDQSRILYIAIGH
jgi:hypothetical protein